MSKQTPTPLIQRVLAYQYSVVAPTMKGERAYPVGRFPQRTYVLRWDGAICRGDLSERPRWGDRGGASEPLAVVLPDGSPAQDVYGLRLQRRFLRDVAYLRTSIRHTERSQAKLTTAKIRRLERATRRLESVATESFPDLPAPGPAPSLEG